MVKEEAETRTDTVRTVRSLVVTPNNYVACTVHNLGDTTAISLNRTILDRKTLSNAQGQDRSS